MTTLECIKFRDVLPVLAIPRLVPGVPVPTVELKGTDFRSADTIAINDVPVESFIIVDKQTIYAEIPPGVSSVRTISVISNQFTTLQKRSLVLFQIGNQSQKISGLLKLTQLFTKVLLQSPGSDIFQPDIGGGLQDMVGRLTSTKRADRLLAQISQAIDTTERQIRRSQLRRADIPVTERLLAATLLDIRMIQTGDEAHARVQIENVAGQTGIQAISL